MIADDILAALKSYIESEAPNHSVVDDLTIVTRDSSADKTHPLVVLVDEATQEHPVLKGVQSPLTVGVYLYTIPHDDGASATATTTTKHQDYTAALYAILADENAVIYLNSVQGIRVFDVRGAEGITSEEDGRRMTRLEIRITCSLAT